LKQLKTLSRRTILDHGHRLKVEDHEVELPDGRVVKDWPWVITRDYVIVLAMTGESRFILFRQPKYGIEGLSLAPVGGYIETGEEPLESARRELLEETGYTARRWATLGSYRVDGNHGAGTAHLFLASEGVKVQEPDSDDVEEQEVLTLTPEEARTALLAGQFKVLAWAAVMALALLKLGPS
jgi:ADP-ribose pyrophosphatase